jgi:hypothetical protein
VHFSLGATRRNTVQAMREPSGSRQRFDTRPARSNKAAYCLWVQENAEMRQVDPTFSSDMVRVPFSDPTPPACL